MKCLDWPLKYIGQTGKASNTRNKEITQATRNDMGSSGYSNHILNTGHKYGIVTDTQDIRRTHTKGKYLNTLEKYHIDNISKNNLQMNDINIDTHNQIFRALHKMNTN